MGCIDAVCRALFVVPGTTLKGLAKAPDQGNSVILLTAKMFPSAEGMNIHNILQSICSPVEWVSARLTDRSPCAGRWAFQ